MSYKIILDPGHGGVINGVYQTAGKRSPVWPDGRQLFEGVFNRNVVNKLHKLCKEYNIDSVVLVPELTDISLGSRVKRVNKIYALNKTSILVSVHANGFSKESANGYETWVSLNASDKSKEIAKVIHKEYLEVNNLVDRGIKSSNFYILKNTNCPAVLLECGFMTNEKECAYLIDEEDKIVEGIFNSILTLTKSERK